MLILLSPGVKLEKLEGLGENQLLVIPWCAFSAGWWDEENLSSYSPCSLEPCYSLQVPFPLPVYTEDQTCDLCRGSVYNILTFMLQMFNKSIRYQKNLWRRFAKKGSWINLLDLPGKQTYTVYCFPLLQSDNRLIADFFLKIKVPRLAIQSSGICRAEVS